MKIVKNLLVIFCISVSFSTILQAMKKENYRLQRIHEKDPTLQRILDKNFKPVKSEDLDSTKTSDNKILDNRMKYFYGWGNNPYGINSLRTLLIDPDIVNNSDSCEEDAIQFFSNDSKKKYIEFENSCWNNPKVLSSYKKFYKHYQRYTFPKDLIGAQNEIRKSYLYELTNPEKIQSFNVDFEILNRNNDSKNIPILASLQENPVLHKNKPVSFFSKSLTTVEKLLFGYRLRKWRAWLSKNNFVEIQDVEIQDNNIFFEYTAQCLKEKITEQLKAIQFKLPQNHKIKFYQEVVSPDTSSKYWPNRYEVKVKNDMVTHKLKIDPLAKELLDPAVQDFNIAKLIAQAQISSYKSYYKCFNTLFNYKCVYGLIGLALGCAAAYFSPYAHNSLTIGSTISASVLAGIVSANKHKNSLEKQKINEINNRASEIYKIMHPTCNISTVVKNALLNEPHLTEPSIDEKTKSKRGLLKKAYLMMQPKPQPSNLHKYNHPFKRKFSAQEQIEDWKKFAKN